jgi:hypothetical protein
VQNLIHIKAECKAFTVNKLVPEHEAVKELKKIHDRFLKTSQTTFKKTSNGYNDVKQGNPDKLKVATALATPKIF